MNKYLIALIIIGAITLLLLIGLIAGIIAVKAKKAFYRKRLEKEMLNELDERQIESIMNDYERMEEWTN